MFEARAALTRESISRYLDRRAPPCKVGRQRVGDATVVGFFDHHAS